MQETCRGEAINFASLAGEPVLLAPSSVQWRIYKDQIALGIGWGAAVLREFAGPASAAGCGAIRPRGRTRSAAQSPR